MHTRVIVFIVSVVLIAGAALLFIIAAEISPTQAALQSSDVTIESLGERGNYEFYRIVDNELGHECYAILDDETGGSAGNEAAPAIDCP